MVWVISRCYFDALTKKGLSEDATTLSKSLANDLPTIGVVVAISLVVSQRTSNNY